MHFKLLLILSVFGFDRGNPVELKGAKSQIIQVHSKTPNSPSIESPLKSQNVHNSTSESKIVHSVNLHTSQSSQPQPNGTEFEKGNKTNSFPTSSADSNPPVVVQFGELNLAKTYPSDFQLKMKVEKMVAEQLARGIITDKKGTKYQMSSLLNLQKLQNSLSSLQISKGNPKPRPLSSANIQNPEIDNNEEPSPDLLSSDPVPIPGTDLNKPQQGIQVLPHWSGRRKPGHFFASIFSRPEDRVVTNSLTLVVNLFAMFMECICDALQSVLGI